MGWVNWSKLTASQKLEATKLRPAWHLSDFQKFNFWIRKDGHVSEARGGRAHQLSDAAICEDIVKAISGEDIRSKGDNREWKPGVTYHFISG